MKLSYYIAIKWSNWSVAN